MASACKHSQNILWKPFFKVGKTYFCKFHCFCYLFIWFYFVPCFYFLRFSSFFAQKMILGILWPSLGHQRLSWVKIPIGVFANPGSRVILCVLLCFLNPSYPGKRTKHKVLYHVGIRFPLCFALYRPYMGVICLPYTRLVWRSFFGPIQGLCTGPFFATPFLRHREIPRPNREIPRRKIPKVTGPKRA